LEVVFEASFELSAGVSVLTHLQLPCGHLGQASEAIVCKFHSRLASGVAPDLPAGRKFAKEPATECFKERLLSPLHKPKERPPVDKSWTGEDPLFRVPAVRVEVTLPSLPRPDAYQGDFKLTRSFLFL
jgi:hypothetical protein